MLTLTFVRPIDLVAPLNIIIITQNNMAYQHKVILCIRDGFGYGFVVGNYIHIIRLIPMFLKSGKIQTHTQTQSKRGKPVKLSLVRVGNHGYGFCCHAYS